ncbi:MAG: alpha-amylase family protein [Bacteroidaceae bacterium]|nr:alpha-amylase family protein [Bacteroidaceae bacterium]
MQRIVIYQLLPRLFGNDNTTRRPGGTMAENGCGKMEDISKKALKEMRAFGVTHVWPTGLLEHATQTSYAQEGIPDDHPAMVKGIAGSPYAIRDYYDVDPDLAKWVDLRQQDFRRMLGRIHACNLKMIMDFVPNHVARHYHSDAAPASVTDFGTDDDTSVAFSPQNNYYYIPGQTLQPDFDTQGYIEQPARATGNDVFHAHPSRNDWYETVKLNYGVDYVGGHTHFSPTPDTWYRMRDILIFWAKEGVDGFRCDMAEMVPVEFWQWVIPQIKAFRPGIIFIAEVYDPSRYRDYVHRGGFDYLYDKVGLYDTLRAVVCHQVSAQEITRCWQSVDDIRGHMLSFLENHDEQRLASDFYAGDPRRGRPALIVAALLYTNPFMLYFGQELGERGMDAEGFSGRDGRTTIFDYWCVDTIRRWRNKGTFDDALLTDEERELKEFYRRTLTLCNENEVLREGDSFDLMYANTHLHRQYAFVRQWNGLCILVIANFSDSDEHIQLTLPAHLFEHFGLMPREKATFYNLYGAKKQRLPFMPDYPLEFDIPANYGSAFQVKCKAT